MHVHTPKHSDRCTLDRTSCIFRNTKKSTVSICCSRCGPLQQGSAGVESLIVLQESDRHGKKCPRPSAHTSSHAPPRPCPSSRAQRLCGTVRARQSITESGEGPEVHIWEEDNTWWLQWRAVQAASKCICVMRGVECGSPCVHVCALRGVNPVLINDCVRCAEDPGSSAIHVCMCLALSLSYYPFTSLSPCPLCKRSEEQ